MNCNILKTFVTFLQSTIKEELLINQNPKRSLLYMTLLLHYSNFMYCTVEHLKSKPHRLHSNSVHVPVELQWKCNETNTGNFPISMVAKDIKNRQSSDLLSETEHAA